MNQVFDPRHAAVVARLRETAPAALPALEDAYQRRVQAHDSFVTALDTFATLASEMRVQQMRQYNGLSNSAASAELAYESARQALIAENLLLLNLEAR